MKSSQSSRLGARSSVRSGTRTKTSVEPEVKTERPQRVPVPKTPKKIPTQSVEEARRNAEERRRIALSEIAEREYDIRASIREGVIDATMLRFVTREELEGDTVAVCEVDNPSKDTYNPNNLARTLYDRAMGPYELTGACDTCKSIGDKCPGHYGKILFKRRGEDGSMEPNPIYNTRYIETLVQVLNCICSHCGKLVISPEHAREQGIMNFMRDRRLKKYSELSQKMKQCVNENCGPHFLYGKSKTDQTLIVRFRDKKKTEIETIYPMMAYDILSAVSDEEMRALGFEVGRPENTLIFFGILVTPPITRVPRTIGNEIMTDDITERYVNIITENNNVRNKSIPANILDLKDKARRELLIHKHFFEQSKGLTEKVMSISKPTSTIGTKRPIGSLYSIVSGKKGVFRSYLNAKVGDYCARSVASPGIDLKVDEIGVPVEWASVLTPSEIVFENADNKGVPYGNRERLQKLLEDGKVVRIERKNNSIAVLKAHISGETKFNLEIGDKVYRHLQNGDNILVNRNPSLHKQSILYHRVRLIPGLSIQLPLSTTPGYNADFDGDEINLFLVQDIQARAEALLIMNVGEALLSESHGSALIAPTFNAPLGIYLMTLPNTQLKMTDLFDIFYATRPDAESRNEGLISDMGDYLDRCAKHKVNPLAGKSVFSVILPRTLNYYSNVKPVKGFIKYKIEIIRKSGEKEVYYSKKEIHYKDENIVNFALEELNKLEAKFKNKEIEKSFNPNYKIVETKFMEKIFKEGTPEEYKTIISTVESVENEVLIRDGILIRGTLTKNNIGQGGDLLTFFYREFKPASSLILINSIDFIANWYLQNRYAFSIGIDDMFDVETVKRHSKEFSDELEKIFFKVESMAKPVKSELEEIKRQTMVIDLLSRANELSFTLSTGADSGYPISNIRHAIQSGAKGKAENLAGSLLSVGLQLKTGSLISPVYGKTRYSPFFPENTYTAESIGFCRRSLSEGFSPAEALSIASSARGDLATMKLGTPTSGYTQRRLATLMSNITIDAYGSAVNGVGIGSSILQPIYGECGFNATSLYRISTDQGEFLSPINIKQLAFQ